MGETLVELTKSQEEGTSKYKSKILVLDGT